MKHQERGSKEQCFDVKIPDRHCESSGPGTMKDGSVLTNQVYRQPWVKHDAVIADPTSIVDGKGKDIG